MSGTEGCEADCGRAWNWFVIRDYCAHGIFYTGFESADAKVCRLCGTGREPMVGRRSKSGRRQWVCGCQGTSGLNRNSREARDSKHDLRMDIIGMQEVIGIGGCLLWHAIPREKLAQISQG